jgi:spore coat polysaccharide biosynthesis protein SpsF (cytidylyltransferase family)
MRVGALVQARMTSSRCPGKVLADIAGRPLLGHLLLRLRTAASLDAVAVATSDETADDPIAAYCQAEGVACHRGSLADVARRMGDAAAWLGLDAFVRICGDSPFLDPALVDRAVTLFREHGPDFVTNCLPKRYPAGQSVEVVSVAAFEAGYRAFSCPDHHEHVTRYFYEQTSRFSIRTIVADRDYGDVSLAVDTAADLARLRLLAAAAPAGGGLGLDALVALCRAAGEARS